MIILDRYLLLNKFTKNEPQLNKINSNLKKNLKKSDFLSQKLIFHGSKKNPSKKSRFFLILVHMNVQNFRYI